MFPEEPDCDFATEIASPSNSDLSLLESRVQRLIDGCKRNFLDARYGRMTFAKRNKQNSAKGVYRFS